MVLDLHGLTIHDGWKSFNSFISRSRFLGFKSVIVITGKGKMSQEIHTWVQLNKNVKECRPNNSGNGSWVIILKPNSNNKVKKAPYTNLVDLYKYFNGY